MGADEAYLLDDAAFQGGDALATAKVLAAAIGKIGEYDIVFFGKQGMGEDNSMVGLMAAELLDLPHINEVVELIIEDGKAVGRREVEGAAEIVESPLPLVLTAHKGLNEPRLPSLKGIMASKKKPIQKWNASDLGLDASETGKGGSRLSWKVLRMPPQKQAGKVLQGEPEEMAKAIADYLSQDLKLY
jgi:electron transfer flavoprotein beta subunit